MKYYFNEQEQAYFIASNFEPKEIPNGYVEITQEEYEENTKETQENLEIEEDK